MIGPMAILETLVRECAAGRPVALCVIVATRGSTPQPAGTMVCVDEASRLHGTLGGGCVEADIRRQAHRLLATGASDSVTFTLDQDFGYDDGMICGGQMDVAIRTRHEATAIRAYEEAVAALRKGHKASFPLRVTQEGEVVEYVVQVEARPKLIIVGGGHLGRELARLAVPLDFDVSVLDDRSDYANATRFPKPVRPVVGAIGETLQGWPIDPNTYIVIITRGHKNDEQALAAVLESPAKYLGMIGSKRKIAVVFDDLRHGGAAEQALARVHAPIGLPIRSVTATEIALSIAAELVSVRRANRSKAVVGPLPISGENA